MAITLLVTNCTDDIIDKMSVFSEIWPLSLNIFYISKILDSLSKGCSLLEYIDLAVDRMKNPPYAELIALSSLRSLRSVFIDMYNHSSRKMTPKEREDFRDSLDAIVGQGLLEVRIKMITGSYLYKYISLPLKLLFSSKTWKFHKLSRSDASYMGLHFPVAVIVVLNTIFYYKIVVLYLHASGCYRYIRNIVSIIYLGFFSEIWNSQ